MHGFPCCLQASCSRCCILSDDEALKGLFGNRWLGESWGMCQRGPGGLPRPAVTERSGFQLACFPCPLPSVAPAGLPSKRSEHLESGAARRGGRRQAGTRCSRGAPRAAPAGPPRRAANQNHSGRMGTRRAPSCSPRPPGDLTRCQASLGRCSPGGCSGLMTPRPHPAPPPGPPPAGYWLPTAKWSLCAAA